MKIFFSVFYCEPYGACNDILKSTRIKGKRLYQNYHKEAIRLFEFEVKHYLHHMYVIPIKVVINKYALANL